MVQSAERSWFAIRTGNCFRAEEILSEQCDDVFLPYDTVKMPSGSQRKRALIPHVLFIKATEQHALQLESRLRTESGGVLNFWIYRYPKSTKIQTVSEREINLLRLLTADDTSRCVIYRKKDFKPGQHVRVKAGQFKDYEGTVQRVKKNRHVVVRIEGICMILLPFIHPDLLEPV